MPRRKAISRGVLLFLLCILPLISSAHADFGPKPSLTVTVINAPEGELYLDLLAEDEPVEWARAHSDEAYDPVILASLRTLETDGWVLACSSGLSHNYDWPSGDLCPQPDGTWYFSYAFPDSFRIAAATADQAQASQNAYHLKSFLNSLVYDWETNTIRSAGPALLLFTSQLSVTLIPTLLIEGALFWLFGFRKKRSWIIFLLVNLATQIGLHLFCHSWLIMAGGHIWLHLLLLIQPEAIICGAEAAAFSIFLREGSVRRCVACALCANAVSFLLSYIPLFFWTVFSVLR